MRKATPHVGRSAFLWAALAPLCLLICAPAARAQIVTNDPPVYGPYNAVFLPDGDGLDKPLAAHDSVLRADSPWSLYAWVKFDEAPKGVSLIAGIGSPLEEYPRYLAIDGSKVGLWIGRDNSLSAPVALDPAKWHFLAATFDGTEFRLYCDGAQVAAGTLDLGSVSAVLRMAPPMFHVPDGQHFGGKISSLTLTRSALGADQIKQLALQPPDFSIVEFEEASKPWPVQTRDQIGYAAPQDPDTMPVSKAPFGKLEAKSLPVARPALEPSGENQWTFAAGWMLRPAPDVSAGGPEISTPQFNSGDWLPATVPGTVLTTFVDRGVYPDPDYGLNNLAIPESLNKQDYWYRVRFAEPQQISGRRLTLTFHGINYKATVWLNGKFLGTVTGAFIRGAFDVTDMLKPGDGNVLAVRVSPPPHPGIPQEQSIKGGPGENGGIMCLDGPTFVATEGWDWIPGVRDRDTGIWQPVTLTATGAVKIGDAQVVTSLPLPDTSRADVEIDVPLDNLSDAPVHGTLDAAFDQTALSEKDIVLPPGETVVKLTPAEFAQLTVQHPRLWWPNGYGKPELYDLKLSFTEGDEVSATKHVRFGIREITYELSLLDSTGHLRRVEFSPTEARAENAQIVNVTQAGMRQVPVEIPVIPPASAPAFGPGPPAPPSPGEIAAARGYTDNWVASLMPRAESSASIHTLDDTAPAPYLVIKVNGVRIACRGGNWGMDDSRKRVSRARLEPFFRLHRDANLNIIRNWVGQSTEEVFYDLADEYGQLVWNDFWESTQNYNIEAEDPALFLANARDTILRYRNHPSIVMWCGRNEGVPQPIINEGLADLIRTLDGTRYYSPSSNALNLQGSGPYRYQDPAHYYTTLNRGFSVETGTPSLATLESFRAWIPSADQWPIDDVWAYHDWHQSGNGDVAPFMAQIEAEFGAATSLEDFERKAQMLNYVDHRAIFEGMNAHLWAPNSGRLLWMTQPAWPSNMWQILSSDYDTQASYYGVKKACEPVHVQLDLSNYEVDVVNTTTAPFAALTVSADVFSLDNKLLLAHQETKNAAADSLTAGFKLDLAPLLANGLVLIKLELWDASGESVSENLYWLGADSSSYRQLNRMPPAAVSVTAGSTASTGAVIVHVQMRNTGSDAALANKLTLLSAADGSRILPAYFSDNYVSLLPGESRDIEIEYPPSAAHGAAQLTLRGWNLAPQTISIAPQK
jgi:glycosyl hydrolase family 2/Ig-like domain-containing protein/concanavalin A-like lectin/glucanase superfamily protein